MISSLVDGVNFNFRAAAVIVHEDHVLLHRIAPQFMDHWSLPGGRVEVGEPSAEAIARELAEELGTAADARVERLLWVVEYFFSYADAPYHELGMYYQVMLDPSSPLLAKDRTYKGVEDDLPLYEGERIRLIFRWFPLDTLTDVPLWPPFLRERLTNLPATPELVTYTRTSVP